MGRKIIAYILLFLAALIVFGPILYTVSISFMDGKEVHSGALLPSTFSFDNYVSAAKNVPLMKFLTNSFIQSGIITLGMLITCSAAAFAFVFIPFKGRSLIFFVVISTMMIPWEATIIPNFATIRDLGWMNTFAGLTVPKIATAFGIFLLRQYFLTIPNELHEAAQIDGCGRFRFYLRMVLPLSRPMLATLAIYSFLTAWNEYLWPLLVTNNNDVRTVQIGLKMMQAQEASTQWPTVMAAVVLIVIPTLLLLFIGQKQLQKGLTSGALKG